MKTYLSAFGVLTVVAVTLFFVNEAVAANAAEEQVYGIIESVLDLVANFLERIFQSLADAVRSVFTGADGGSESA